MLSVFGPLSFCASGNEIGKSGKSKNGKPTPKIVNYKQQTLRQGAEECRGYILVVLSVSIESIPYATYSLIVLS